jgi:hypothetical protein
MSSPWITISAPSAVRAPAGSLSRASAMATLYGVELPLVFRIDTAAARVPPSSPSRATT